jgi:tight adherence protein B
MRSEDTDLIISSILVARETGGDLTKVFSRLIGTIRDRMEIKEMTSTLTLQGRIQGIIMSLIPVIFVVVITKFNPDHFKTFLNDEVGRGLLMLAGFMQLMAFIFIKKFSTVKI